MSAPDWKLLMPHAPAGAPGRPFVRRNDWAGDDARADFARRTGLLPEHWLARWRRDEVVHDLRGDLLAVEAERLALEASP